MDNEGFVVKDGVLIKCKGPGGDVAIPEGVKTISDRAFVCRGDITGATIPDGVTAIGDFTFACWP